MTKHRKYTGQHGEVDTPSKAKCPPRVPVFGESQ